MRHPILLTASFTLSVALAALVAGCGSVAAPDSSACTGLSACCLSMANAANQVACESAVAEGNGATCSELLVGYTTNGGCGSTVSTGTATNTFTVTGTGTRTGTGTQTGMFTGTVTGTGTFTGTGTGTGTQTQTGTDTGTGTGTSITSTSTGPTGPIAPSGSVPILTNALVDVVGLTSDDYLVYFDAKNGVSATDITGTVTQIAPGPTTDGGIGPIVAGIGGDIVAILTDYTTQTVSGVVQPVAGTLSIWSHTLGSLRQVATGSTGILAIAPSSSYVVYTDGSDPTGKKGNIGVVSGTAAGATDLAKSVVIDITSTTCSPWATVDAQYVVTSTCALDDGGNLTPAIRSWNGAASWSSVVLATGGGVSSPYESGAVNFVTDTIGDDVLTLSGTPTVALSAHGITSATALPILASFAAPTSGTEFFYLSHASTFAVFTQSTGELGLATFATPSSTPVVKTLSTQAVLGVQTVSPDEKWDVDYGTAVDTSTGAPTSLNLRNLSTGAATALIVSGSGLATTFGGVNAFTTDSSYVVYSTDLKVVGTEASTGTLFTASVANGAINQIVTNTSVWNASPLTGTNLVYSQNYLPNTTVTDLPNGAATADIYTVAAGGSGPGTLVVAGADAPDYFWVTHDKSHMFFTFSQLRTVDGGFGLFNTDGLYSIALP